MNDIYFNSEEFSKTNEYQEFITSNQGQGYLNIRAYTASSAIPISGLEVTVYKIINNRRIIFFQGATDTSGTISQISLPTPLITDDNEVVPPSEEYEIMANYDNKELLFKIKMFSNIQVIQNINVSSTLRLDGSIYGS